MTYAAGAMYLSDEVGYKFLGGGEGGKEKVERERKALKEKVRERLPEVTFVERRDGER